MKMKKLSLPNKVNDPVITNCLGTPVPDPFYRIIRSLLNITTDKEETENEKKENSERI